MPIGAPLLLTTPSSLPQLLVSPLLRRDEVERSECALVHPHCSCPICSVLLPSSVVRAHCIILAAGVSSAPSGRRRALQVSFATFLLSVRPLLYLADVESWKYSAQGI